MECNIPTSSCHDQPVIDHIASDWSGPDKVRLEVHKIVEGQQEFMGTLDCTQRADAILSCTGNTPKKDAWEFSFLFRACRNFGVQLFESDVLQFLYWSSSFLVSMIGGVVIVCSAIQQTLTPPRPRVLSKNFRPARDSRFSRCFRWSHLIVSRQFRRSYYGSAQSVVFCTGAASCIVFSHGR